MKVRLIRERIAVAAGAVAAGLTLSSAFDPPGAVVPGLVLTAVVVAALLPRGWWALPAAAAGPVIAVAVAAGPLAAMALDGHPPDLSRPAGWAHLGGMLLTGPGRALRLTLPLPDELSILPATLAGVAAAAGSVLARRRPGGLECLAPAAVTGAFGVLAAGIGAGQVRPVCLGLVAAAVLLVAHRRPARQAILAVLLAAVPLLFVSRTAAPNAADPRDRFRATARVATGVDVLDQVGGWLAAPADEVLFTAAGPPVERWRLAVLDDYDGQTWRSSGRPVAAGRGVPPHQGPVPAGAVTRTIELAGLAGPYLPAADRPVRVGPPVDAVDPDTGVLLTSHAQGPGTRYQVTSLREPSAAAPSPAATAVPDDLRPALQQFLDAVPASGAEAVAAALRHGRRNVTGAPSTSATPAIAGLLRPGGTGTTVQFAAAYALAMRMRGVPARLVVGFAGGNVVHGRDVRVWTEVRLAGTWATVDPTPPPTSPGTPPRPNEPPPVAAATVAAPAGDESPPSAPPHRAGPGLPWPGIGAVVLALAAAALAARIASPRVHRAWRRYRPGSADARVAGAWHDVLDAYRSPAGDDRAALTPGLLHERLRPRLGDTEPAGLRLSRLADRALYSPQSCSPGDAGEAWHLAKRVRRALRRPRSGSRRAENALMVKN